MKRIVVVMSILFIWLNSYSQQRDSISLHNKWGVEISILTPVAKIYMLQATYSLWKHNSFSGDILLGIDFQNWEGDNTGQQEAYSLIIGYRQYIWKGLNIDYQFIPDYAFYHSSIDNKTYEGFNIWHELKIGYNISVTFLNRDFYIIPQIGFGRELYTGNPWPEFEKDAKLIPTPNLWIGMKL